MNLTSRKLLKILADGKFHSGENLGEQLGITRSAIWKIIQQLQNLGIVIDSKPSQGYHIVNGLELLDKKLIQKNLTSLAKKNISAIDIFESLDSTNDFLLQQSKLKAKSGAVCLAEHQSAGRGRQGRTWHSPFGANLYLSLLWHFHKDASDISGLSLAIAIAVVRALKKYGISEGIALKWPNDILWAGKKLAGILLEMTAEMHHKAKVIIGIGLNIAMPHNNKSPISQAWTDIQEITAQSPQRNMLTSLLLNELIDVLVEFSDKGLKPFVKEWQQWDNSYNKAVQLKIGDHLIEGIAKGITQDGKLRVENSQFHIQEFSSGEVSLRLKI